jgi:hypothetical protein
MTNIETGVSTLKGLAEWILKQGIELQMREIRTFDDNLADNEPWRGVIKDYEDYVVISDEWTRAQYAEHTAAQRRQDEQRSYESWNRPEVREAQEKGLLP